MQTSAVPDLAQPMSAEEFDQILRRLGWSQEMAAKQLGFTVRHIHRLRNGVFPVPRAHRHLLRLLIKQRQEIEAHNKRR